MVVDNPRCGRYSGYSYVTSYGILPGQQMGAPYIYIYTPPPGLGLTKTTQCLVYTICWCECKLLKYVAIRGRGRPCVCCAIFEQFAYTQGNGICQAFFLGPIPLVYIDGVPNEPVEQLSQSGRTTVEQFSKGPQIVYFKACVLVCHGKYLKACTFIMGTISHDKYYVVVMQHMCLFIMGNISHDQNIPSMYILTMRNTTHDKRIQFFKSSNNCRKIVQRSNNVKRL